jgi:predicted ABC-type exoprotein transport system permease subunit
MTFMMKSRADEIQGMLAIIQSKIFCLPILYKKTKHENKTVILLVALYGHKTWFLTLRVFEKRVMRRVFGPKRGEDRSWRKLNNDELLILYSSSDIVRVIKSRRMRWAGHVACMGEGRGVYRVLVGRPEGKRPLGRLGHWWEDMLRWT